MDSFGQKILKARKSKGYSQKELADLIGLDFTYLSKLENDHANYPPKENVIRSIAEHLELDAEELIYLAGRVTVEDSKVIQELAKTYQKQIPVLLRKMRDNPELVKKLISSNN